LDYLAHNSQTKLDSAQAGKAATTMLHTKIKIATAALLAVTLAGTSLWHSKTWAKPMVLPREEVRIVVNEIVREDCAVVIQIEIESTVGTNFEVVTDKKDKSGAASVLSTSAGHHADRPNKLTLVQFTILGDHVETEGKDGRLNVVKFMLGQKIGAATSNITDAKPMPADARQLSDLMTVWIKPGAYNFGRAIKLVTFRGVTYSLVVTKPKSPAPTPATLGGRQSW
jgi:hypothetical protein